MELAKIDNEGMIDVRFCSPNNGVKMANLIMSRRYNQPFKTVKLPLILTKKKTENLYNIGK